MPSNQDRKTENNQWHGKSYFIILPDRQRWWKSIYYTPSLVGVKKLLLNEVVIYIIHTLHTLLIIMLFFPTCSMFSCCADFSLQHSNLLLPYFVILN